MQAGCFELRARVHCICTFGVLVGHNEGESVQGDAGLSKELFGGQGHVHVVQSKATKLASG